MGKLYNTQVIDVGGGGFSRPLCPYVDKEGGLVEKRCWPDISFAFEPKCQACENYWKNYYAIVYDSIRRAENSRDDVIHKIRENVKRDGGKFILIDGKEYGLLCGATTTIEDYSYIYLNHDKILNFFSCDESSYKVIENVPSELSVLAWMHDNDREALLKSVKKSLGKFKHDVMITDFYV